MNMRSRSIRGFTLLEVLVAVLIFSLGLMGLAGLLAVSVKTNHAAYLRTQATFLAQGMADRMRANVLGLWKNSYNLPTTAALAFPQAAPATTCSAGSCAYSDVALRDLAIWQQQLASFLPSPTAMINCSTTQTPTTDQMLTLPPYSGTCEMQITWGDVSNLAGKTSISEQVSFDWVFQP
jgi:type IV pilus assembly protein PilV